MLISNDELSELFDIIDYFHILFIADTIGVDTLTSADRRLLISKGIDIADFETADDYMAYAYKFGILASALKGSKKIKDLKFADLKKFISSGKFIPLTPSEQFALDYIKQQAYNDIRGLGNRIKHDTGQIFIEASRTRRTRTERTIRKEGAKAIKDRKTVTELSSELGHKTKDWSRDFDRIADYIMHDAYEHGIASQLLKEHGENVEVFFSVYKGACNHCIELYLTGEVGSEPKIFKLKDVLANGSNIGRKAVDWKATVSPIHPWCRCTMHNKPENSVWDKVKHQFVLIRNTYGVERKSKVKITITKI